MPPGKFKGIIHVSFKDQPGRGNIGLEWSSDRRHATFQVGMELVFPSRVRQEGAGWMVKVIVIGNDGRAVASTEMRIVYGWYNGKDHRMVICAVEDKPTSALQARQ